MLHCGPKTQSDSDAKSCPRAAAPCSSWEGRAQIPQESDAPRLRWRVGHTGMAPGTDPGWRNWGGLEQQGSFCFMLLKCIIFWTDEEVSALNSSGKAFFLPLGPPCISVAAGEHSRKELTLLLVS